MSKISFFLADDDSSLVDEVEKHFAESAACRLVGSAGSGKDAIDRISKLCPDVAVLDLVLPFSDGFAVLEHFQREGYNKTKFIVLSSLTHENFIIKALSLGASYYMLKPVNCELLEQRIIEIAKQAEELKAMPRNVDNKRVLKNKNLDERISNIFVSVGIPAHIKGYQFLREGIKLAVDNPQIINSITKGLYPAIANRYSTSSSKVERAIRHAIEVAWNRGKIENINSLFGVKVYTSNDKPTNGEFIALLADKMLLEGA